MATKHGLHCLPDVITPEYDPELYRDVMLGIAEPARFWHISPTCPGCGGRSNDNQTFFLTSNASTLDRPGSAARAYVYGIGAAYERQIGYAYYSVVDGALLLLGRRRRWSERA